METTTRNVWELPSDERAVYEAALGQKLRENQQVILKVITLNAGETETQATGTPAQVPAGHLPDWCNVYEGLSDEQIEEVEKVILDRSGWERKSS